jgi:hypothetical protein
LLLSDASAGVTLAPNVLGFINNDDAPAIRITDATVTETDSGTVNAVLTVTAVDDLGPLRGASMDPVPAGSSTFVQIDYASANDSAVAPGDYAARSGSLSFDVNDRSETITVPVQGDTLVEATEQFFVNLTLATGSNPARIDDGQGVVTITDNDSAITASINDISVNESASTAMLTVTLSANAPAGGTSIDFTTMNGTATQPGDYATTSGTVQIAAGSNSAAISVPINNDSTLEPSENFIVRISNARATTLRAVNYSISKADGIVTIADDDTTTVVVDTPDPTVVGEAFSVSVTVSGNGDSPASGTVAVSAGNLSCGPITLSATGTGSCQLTGVTVGNLTITASYTPSVGNGLSASSGSTAHTVNPAATSLSLSGPARVRINQTASFNGALLVTAPGAGIPAGTVTLTSTGSTGCSYTTPAASNCSLSWNTLGAKTISASFAPSNANFLASSTTAVTNTFVFALADLNVSISNQVNSYQADQLLIYTLILENRGPDFAPGVRLQSAMPGGISKTQWNCAAVGGAICPEAGGVLDINALVRTLPANSSLIYTISGRVNRPTPPQISASASVTLPTDGTIEDPVLSNQSASDIDVADALLKDGFEIL